LPLFSTSSIVTEAGGLLSYGGPVNKIFREWAITSDDLERGRSGDLPVEQPTEVILVINMKTERST
jgi:hypothetical protein